MHCLFYAFALATTFAVTNGLTTCDQLYSLLESSGYCYRLYSWPALNYWEASEYCQSVGAQLASIHNAVENTFIKSLGSGPMLIGLRYNNSTSTYQWSDGTSFDYNNFASYFDEQRQDSGSCALYHTQQWENAECNEDRLKFVCRKKDIQYTASATNTCPSGLTVRTTGLLLSPGYPSAAVGDCWREISAPDGYVLKLFIDEYDMSHSYLYVNSHGTSGVGDGDMMEFVPATAVGHQVILPTNKVNFGNLLFDTSMKFRVSFQAKVPAGKALPPRTSRGSRQEDHLCATGYELFGETCYRFVSDIALDYYGATAYCRVRGGNLASIHDAHTDAFLQGKIVSEEALIGLRFRNNTFQWSDGTVMDYNSHEDGFSSQLDYRGFCTKLSGSEWQSTECTNRLNFICQIHASSATPNSVCSSEGTIHKDGGVVTSPGYPQSATQNPKCAFQMIVKEGYFVKVFLEEMDFFLVSVYSYVNNSWVGTSLYGRPGQGSEIIIPFNRIKVSAWQNQIHSGKWKISFEGIEKP